MSPDNKFDTDVLVVGTGPMGATTALALATYGVRVHVVNRYNWTANTPRAHITNQRAVEVLRDLGVEKEARRDATPWEWMGDTLFTTSLAGSGDRAPAHLGHRRRAHRRLPAGQPLRHARPAAGQDGAAAGQERGGTRRCLLLQHRVPRPRAGCRRRDGAAARPAGPGANTTMRARYLVGADGAQLQGHGRCRPEARGPACPCRDRLCAVPRRPDAICGAPAEHPLLDRHVERRVRRDRHGPAARHRAVEPVDRRLGFRHEQGRARLLSRRKSSAGCASWWAIPNWRSRSTAPRSGTSTRRTRRSTPRVASSAVATRCIAIRRRADWVRTPACRTRSTWPGSSRSS